MTLPRIGIDYRPAILTGAGIGRSVRELCRALAAAGELELHLFAHSFGRARITECSPTGARLHRLPIPGRSLPFLARLGIDGGRLAGGVPVFHWTDYIHPPLTTAAAVLTVHDLAFTADPAYHGAQSSTLLERCRRAAERATRILCPTRATADMVEERLGIDAARVTVIPFGCDHVPDEVGPPPLADPYIVAIGTVEPRKNHRRLLAAWRALPAPRPRLCVIGRRGWECDAIVADLQQAAAEDGVLWLEDLPDAAAYTFLAHARLLAYPSHLEGFGFPPLEAMALGTPVVAGNTPALREVLGDAAVFCDTRDTEDLSHRLHTVLTDTDLRRDLVAKGRARAAEFTWHRAASAHAEVYRACTHEATS